MTTETNITTAALRNLHRIHRQLADLRERLGRGPRLARAHEANLKGAEEQLAQTRADAHKCRMTADRKQGDLKSSEAAIEKRRRQLNEAKDNREYQLLREDIAAAVAAKDVLEVEVLECLERLDEYEKKIAEGEAALTKTRQDGDRIRHDVLEQEPRIRGDIERLEAELRHCEACLPHEFRELYNRVIRARGEDALAALNDEFCGGCNQHIPLNMVNALMLSRPVFCKACGRLLYMPEDAKPRPAEAGE